VFSVRRAADEKPAAGEPAPPRIAEAYPRRPVDYLAVSTDSKPTASTLRW
jgi:hypothetical protein